MSYVPPSRYEYFGSTIHLVIRTLSDLDQVLKLNEVFWLATTAPASDFLLPAEFLKLIDIDGDGRVRVEEVKTAIAWLRTHSTASHPTLALKREQLKSPELKQAWDKIATAFELDPGSELARPQLREMSTRFQEQPTAFGAGALAPEELDENTAERRLAEAILETVQPEKEAVTEEQLDHFLSEAAVVTTWREASPGQNEWAEEYPVFRDLSTPLERYFLMAETAEFTGIQPDVEWPVESGKLKELPLVRPLQAEKVDFEGRINPAYREEIVRFRKTFLGAESILTREHYQKLRERFETYADWLSQAPSSPVNSIPSETLKPWLEDEGMLDRLRTELREKRQAGLVLRDFQDLEKLLLFQAHLVDFCRNFVAFPDLYNPNARALFERGTLVLDAREFHLALPVDDLEAHKAAATRSNMFVLYIEVSGTTLAVPVTSGTRGNLARLKRGVFRHVDGTEREARVIDIVTNPISLGEALLAPFEKVGQALKNRIEGLSSEKERELVAKTTESAPPKAKKDSPSGTMLAGGGVAIAAVGSSLAFVLKTLASLSALQILFGLACLFLIVLLPAALVAFLKLRTRDLSAVLEGNAWGINARMRLSTIQARQFTQSPRHPGFVGSSMGFILILGLFILAGCAAYFFRDQILDIFSWTVSTV